MAVIIKAIGESFSAIGAAIDESFSAMEAANSGPAHVSDPTGFQSGTNHLFPLVDLIRRIESCTNLADNAPDFRAEFAQLRDKAMSDDSSALRFRADIISTVSLIDEKLALTDAERLDILAIKIRKSLSEVGLFRVGGTPSGAQILLDDFSPKAVEEIKDVHTLTKVFKEILRKQNPPLLNEIKDDLLEIGEQAAAEEKKEGGLTQDKLEGFAQRLSDLIQGLGDKEKLELKIVLDLCSEVTDKSEVNLMDAANLATCIAPNLYKPVDNLETQLRESAPMNTVVKLMIKKASEII